MSSKKKDSTIRRTERPGVFRGKEKLSTERESVKKIQQKLGALGVLLTSIAQIERKGLVYYFLSDAKKANNTIKIGAEETLHLYIAKKNLEILGLPKEISAKLDELTELMHKYIMEQLNKLEQN